MFDSLLDTLGNSWLEYPLILAFCLFDAVLPILPSETVLLTGGILAADGKMALGWVMAMGAIGAFAGDNVAYGVGHSADDWARRWLARGRNGERRLAWAHRELDRHGGPLVVVARFIPGGRTVTTISCGVLEFPYRQFLAFDAIGVVLWATLSTLIGFVGGHTFEDRPLVAFAVSFGVALAFAGGIELIRWMRRRKRSRAGSAGSA
ncbi:MAG: DedA family protein [Mycobacteriaceae bacterium]|nr:DedA family protein [Mycobacteriaceae bacterium]